MQLVGVTLLAAFAGLVVGDAVNDLEAKGRTQINDYIASGSKGGCTKDKLSVRREWYGPSIAPWGFLTDGPRGDLSKPDRKAYLDAVVCLFNKPSKLDSKQFPGAKSRYDDFVVVHMNQTLTIHGTVREPYAPQSRGRRGKGVVATDSTQGNFLSWHRYYTWNWERVLRAECGFKGTQPVRDQAAATAQTSLCVPVKDVLTQARSIGTTGGGPATP